MNPVKPFSNFWHDVYHANLMNAMLALDGELINHTFMVNQPHKRTLDSKARNFNEKFSQMMFDWILSGEPNVTEAMLAMNPFAKNYSTIFSEEGHPLNCVAYGTRIREQLPYVMEMLKLTDGTTRRAEIMILKPEDIHVGLALEKGQTNCEYPCTLGFNFRVRNHKVDMITSMRSNNYTTTVCQDFYVFTLLQQHIASMLGMSMGKYYHHTQSGHVFDNDRVRAKLILQEYITKDNAFNNSESEHWEWSEAYASI